MSKIFMSVPDGPYWKAKERAIHEGRSKQVQEPLGEDLHDETGEGVLRDERVQARAEEGE